MLSLQQKKRFVVKVPASSGNIGPGFDVLGLALDLYSELEVQVVDEAPGEPIIDIFGEGEDSVPRDKRNVIFEAIDFVFKKAGKRAPRLRLVCKNRIPLTRGMGSSSAAILAGLLAGNRLLGDKFSRQDILNWASAMEGHPDNVAPALLGGVQASAVRDGRVICSNWPIPKVKLVVAIPSFELSTKKARKVVPRKLPMKDAIYNLSCVALMPVAFSGHPELMQVLLDDRWHEPYRAKLIPGFNQVKHAALRAGAYGVTLSGAGPTMLGFCPPQKVKAIESAMQKAFKKAGVSCRTMEVTINKKGALIQ